MDAELKWPNVLTLCALSSSLSLSVSLSHLSSLPLSLSLSLISPFLSLSSLSLSLSHLSLSLSLVSLRHHQEMVSSSQGQNVLSLQGWMQVSFMNKTNETRKK